MQILTLDEFMSLIPNETKNYVKSLFGYLYYEDYIQLPNRNLIINELDKLLYKALKTYYTSSGSGKNVLNALGYTSNVSLDHTSVGSETSERLFATYYNALTPLKEKEEYLLLTPEDIINNIYNGMKKSYIDFETFQLIPGDEDKFFKRIYECSITKKESLRSEYINSFNKNYSISVINYYQMVGKIYLYLNKHKEKIIEIASSSEDLKNLSMLIAVFYYEHVSVYGDSYHEQNIILDYFASKGFTKEQLTQNLGLDFSRDKLDKYDPTLILTKEFSNIHVRDVSKDNLTVGLLVNKVINEGIGTNISVKRLLGSCNLTISDISKVQEELKQKKSELNDTSIEDLYKGLMPNVISYLKRLSQIYTYLLSKQEQLDKTIITEQQDLYVLSILLSSYEFKSQYNDFFVENGLFLDKVLELVNLPKKEVYKKELNNTTPNEKEITKYARLITSGINYEKSKDSITVESILMNTTDKSRTKTMLLQKLYKTITSNPLDGNFENQIKNYFHKKEETRKREKTENLLSNVSIDVFNFLKVVCSYYIILKNKKLDAKDHEQLSIIFAASRYKKEMEKYLDDLGMTRKSLSNAFNVEFSYQDKTFDIDIIDEYFRPYIFDRKPEDITIYSIFENAFNPSLTNTLNLRRVLFKYGKNPEDFIGIEEKINEMKKKELQKNKEEKVQSLWNRLDDQVRRIMEDTIRIQNYTNTHKIDSNIVKTENDYQELSVLIAIFLNDANYIPFFTHNGVSLEEILLKVGIPKQDLLASLNGEVDNSKILSYEKYLKNGYNKTDLGALITALFNDEINDSKVLETITALLGNNYSYLVEEVTNKKERELTPTEGIVVLKKEPVMEISDSSLSSIVDYGTSISKHSKYINDALHELVFSDTLEHSLDGINALLGEVSYEEHVESQERQSFFERLFYTPEPPKVIKKYNPNKIGDLQIQVDEQIQILTKELKGYEFIKKYIELYLKKLSEHLSYLKKYYQSLNMEELDDSMSEIDRFTKTLDQNSVREILLDKITTFETMILLMKQELISVHRSIISHFITINSLQTSKSAILPLLATEIAINVGNKSEGEALELTGNLISLLDSVVNKNAEATRQNLEKLRLTSLSDENFQSMHTSIEAYLKSLNSGREILELTEPSKEEGKGPKK